MSDAIKLAIDFLHCVDQRFDLAKEPHAPGVTMLDQFHAALAALRAQPASQYLCNGTPFKVAVRNGDAMLPCLPDELGGRWVALVAAEDDCHLRAQPDHSEQYLELASAARAVVERWDTPSWKDVPATAVYINRLRDTLPPAIGETME